MEKRLTEAFDRMTMPEDCARRIEERLAGEKMEPQRFTMVLNRKEKSASWKWAAAACALLLLMGLPFLPVPPAEETAVPEASEPVSAEETLTVLEQPGIPFWQEGREVLDPLCRNMPDWKGYASLEDSFWTELTVRTLNGYTQDRAGRLHTQAGQASLVNGRIRMERDTLSAYVEKIMGISLPQFTPCGPYGDLLSYEGEAYYVENTVFSQLTYTLKDWKRGNYPEVTYAVCPAPGGEELGTVTFLLSQGEQEGEYVVLDKTTSGRRTPQAAPEMEAVAMAYAQNYFANDTEGIVAHMTSRSDWELVLSQLVRNMYTGSYPGGWNESRYEIESVTAYGFAWDTRPPLVYVTYTWESESYAGRYSLVLYMSETAEGWKVRFSDEDAADSYDPEIGKIRLAAERLAYAYARGDGAEMKLYMTASPLDPPVHECTTPESRFADGGSSTGADAAVYYDPEERDPVTGELRADVWVEFTATDQDLDGDVLILHMVKREDEWKAETISEG